MYHGSVLLRFSNQFIASVKQHEIIESLQIYAVNAKSHYGYWEIENKKKTNKQQQTNK